MYALLLLALVVAAPVPKGPADEMGRDWGTRVDPDKDCRFRLDKGRLRITIPGTPHVMSAERGTTNAPRVVRDVAGDFTAEVRVSSDFPTDDKALVDRRWAFYGAGLVVWADEKNYIRFERARMHIAGRGWRCYPSWEMREDGEVARGWAWADGTLEEDRPAYLRLTRKGDELTAAVSQDGKEWRELPALKVKFGRTVKVGVIALQNTKAGYEAEFEALKVVPAGKPK
jgi:regulation of enolase protein 1 (concanavalin A-like superfamily)